MRGIAFFDIDGTLAKGVTSGAFIADGLGHGGRMRKAEEAYARGEMTNVRVCQIDSKGYSGRAVDEIMSVLEDMPLVDGISDAVHLCQSMGFRPVLASCTWTLVSQYLARRFGFANWRKRGLTPFPPVLVAWNLPSRGIR